MKHASVFSGIGGEWKPIKGYENKYVVSSNGDVASLDYTIMQKHPKSRKIHPYTYKGKLIKKTKNNSGYLTVGLRNTYGKRRFLVHRLVADAFIPNSNNYPQVNHKNEDKTDNRKENLEWCTALYNCNYGNAKKKLSDSHLNHPALSKAVVSIDKYGNKTTYLSASEAARKTKINISNIVRCCNKVKYYLTAGGYKWEYRK